MQLTGKEIIEQNIVNNYCEEGIQQQGIDVRLDSVVEVEGLGYVPTNGKTILPAENKLVIPFPGSNGQACYHLTPGYYEVTFMEGCKMPNNKAMYFKTRSSLVRCGAIIHSGQFDAGFETKQAGAFLEVLNPITIEKGARVAQMIVHESHEVDNVYNGQWQKDKQRK